MNSDNEIDSLCAESENKDITGDYNVIHCNDEKQENKSREYGNVEKVDQTNENQQQSDSKLIEHDFEKHDFSDLREVNSTGHSDAIDGPSEMLVDASKEKGDNEITTNGAKLVPDTVDKETVAIFQFSDTLAETILQEALLINDIYTRDKVNIDNLTESEELERDLNIKKTLFPGDNGVISGRESGVGYDRYLIDKFLRSKADPEEIPDADGFDGIEEHFKRDKECTYPGLDSDDAYVRAGLERPESDREASDRNNNQMSPGIIEQFDESILQTIHEDAELVIDYANDVKEGVTIEQVAIANQDDDLIDEGVVEDVAPNTDEADDVLADDEHEENEQEKVSQPTEDAIEKEEVEKSIQPDPEEPTETGTAHVIEDIEDSEDEDEEADCCDMTYREKKMMVNAVRLGDIDRLERLLEKKNADMNMNWYGENLLMVAIRSGKEAMCEFLIDNGINWQHQNKLVEVDENDGEICVHKIGARQMAYDLHLFDTVELLDCKSDNLFPFIVPKLREPRLREPIFPMCPPPLDEGIRQEVFMDQDELLKEHKKDLVEQARIRAELIEENLKNEKLRKSVTTTGPEDDTFHTVKSKHSCSDDDISQVFGPDEGYETMSPDLSRSNRHDYNHVFEQPTSIRSTRACNLLKAHNAKVHLLKRSESPDYPMYNNNLIESVGSYSFESRYWHMPKSAPQLRNYSMESLNDTSVRMGLPFVHGDTRKRLNTTPQSARPSVAQRRTASAHTNISPFSQVAKLLEQSRLFSPLEKSRATTPHLPSISSRKSSAVNTTHTRINYIYADRNSAKTSDTYSERSDLLPRRKLKC